MAIRLRTTDRLFARFCRTGDASALGRVFDRTAGHLLHIAAWLVGNRHDAEDLLQRTFLTAIEDRGSFATERNVMPWLVGILTNHARNLQRERARRAALPGAEERSDDPGARAADRELLDAMTRAREALVSPYREVLELHLAQGLDAQEIAARLGRPAGTVRTQLVRALELLRRRLPSGFVAGLAPIVMDPGTLAAVKATILAAAREATAVSATVMAGAVTTAVATGGILMAKKIVWAVPLFVLLVGFATYSAWPTTPEQPVADVASAATASLDRPTPAAVTPVVVTSGERLPEREPVAAPTTSDADPGFGSLRVLVHWKHDGRAAGGVGVDAIAFSLPSLCWRNAVTDAAGVAVLRHLAPGSYRVGGTHMNDAAAVTLAADRQEQVELLAERACYARGRVVDHDGLPVGDASICDHEDTANAQLGLSDAGGHFAVPLLRSTILVARKAGQVSSYGRSLRPEPGKDFDIELALRGKAGAVHGTVRDGNGAPIGWTTVQIGQNEGYVVPSGSPDIHLTMPYPARVLTGRDGEFRIDDVGPGESPVIAWAIGFGPSQQSVKFRPGEVTELAITLPAGAVVAGVVRDAAGQPVAGARIWFGEEFVRFPTAHATAAADGRFRIADLPAGPVRLHAAKEQSKVTANVDLRAGTTTAWDPVLGKGRTIAGTVLGPDDLPFAGTRVGTVHPNYQRVMEWSETDAAGRFEVPNVGDNPAPLQVEKDGASLVETAKIAPDTRDVVIRITAGDLPTARFRGRIVDTLGRAVSGSVHSRRSGLTNSNSQQLDASTGGFVFGPMPAGRYELSGWSEKYGQLTLGTIDLEPGQERVLDDVVLQEPGAVELTVFDAAGNPADAKHTMLRSAAGLRAQGCEIKRGKGKLGVLQPGRYFFECSTGRAQLARTEFEVRSGTTSQVELHGNAVVQATIRFRDPEPANADLSVTLQLHTSDGRFAAFAETYPQNPEPLAQRVDLPIGSYRIDGTASDGRRVTAEIAVRSLDDRPELTIDLPRR